MAAYIKFLTFCSYMGYCVYMDRVVRLRLSEDEKVLWVQAAHGELVSLSEWIRRACAARLGAGDGNGSETGKGGRPDERASAASLSTGPMARAQVPSPAPSLGRPCRRLARHHTNHGGRPCPVCGFPNVT